MRARPSPPRSMRSQLGPGAHHIPRGDGPPPRRARGPSRRGAAPGSLGRRHHRCPIGPSKPVASARAADVATGLRKSRTCRTRRCPRRRQGRRLTPVAVTPSDRRWPLIAVKCGPTVARRASHVRFQINRFPTLQTDRLLWDVCFRREGGRLCRLPRYSGGRFVQAGVMLSLLRKRFIGS